MGFDAGDGSESIHKDTTPHDIGDHVDWTDPFGNKWKWVEDSGKWHPDPRNVPNRPQPTFPPGTLVDPDDSGDESPVNEPSAGTVPTQEPDGSPFWVLPAFPRPSNPFPSIIPKFPVPAFPLPLFIIPVIPKPESTIPGYEGPPLA